MIRVPANSGARKHSFVQDYEKHVYRITDSESEGQTF